MKNQKNYLIELREKKIIPKIRKRILFSQTIKNILKKGEKKSMKETCNIILNMDCNLRKLQHKKINLYLESIKAKLEVFS